MSRYGLCQACGRPARINADGKLRAHGRNGKRCPGSNESPEYQPQGGDDA